LLLLLIGLWGLGILSFSVLGLLLLGTGIVLLLVELFVEPGFGIFGILGVAAIILGMFTFEAEPFFVPRIFDAAALVAIGAAIALGVFFAIIGKGVAATFRTQPVTGPEALIGKKAEVITDLAPDGQVRFEGQVWKARSADKVRIAAGEAVHIVRVEGNTLFVTTSHP
jgi:membrane-bound serine protease (ClpP class)